MIEVFIDSVRVNLMSPQRLVILRESSGERYLPIWVGPYEAEAITVALQEVEMSRPLTHDLIRNVFNTFNARIVRVEITSLREITFFGNIVTDYDGREVNIDSRPSDAIALAVRARVPILVHESVMDEASIVPEKDVSEAASASRSRDRGVSSPPAEINSERLDVFKDFLDKLDIDKPDAPAPDKET